MDTDCISEIEKYVSGFNVFDVLKIAKAEIRHSNVIAWLMDPYETHEIEDAFMTEFSRLLFKYKNVNDDDGFDLPSYNLSDLIVQRERWNIDILAYSPQSKCIFCIENKNDSVDSEAQLEGYEKIVDDFKLKMGGNGSEQEEAWKDYFIYLTKDGIQPQNIKETNGLALDIV